MKKCLILIVASFLPFSLMAEPATTHKERPRCMDHEPKSPEKPDISSMQTGLPPFLRDLNLSEAQEDSIFKLMYGQIPSLREQGKQRHQTMDALRKLANSTNFDDARAQKLAEQLAGIEKELILTRVRNEARIYSILTPEQRQKLEEKRSDRRNKRPDEFVKYRLENQSAPIRRRI